MNLSALLCEISELDSRIGRAITHVTKTEVGPFDEELKAITNEAEVLISVYKELLALVMFSGTFKKRIH